MKDRTGSSNRAIKGYITTNYSAIKFAPHLFRAALKKGVETGKLVQIKSSYKIASGSTGTSSASKGKKAVPTKAAPAKKSAAAPKKSTSEGDEVVKKPKVAKKVVKKVGAKPKSSKAASAKEKSPAKAKAKSPSKAKAAAPKKARTPKAKAAAAK